MNKNSPVWTGHAERCPICDGSGRLNNNLDVCHGCSGKGWVSVMDESVLENVRVVTRVVSVVESSRNCFGDENSPLFGKGTAPIYYNGCAANCHTGHHRHHSFVPYIYGELYDKVCARCGHKAAVVYGTGVVLCDCCMEDWSEQYKTQTDIKRWVVETN